MSGPDLSAAEWSELRGYAAALRDAFGSQIQGVRLFGSVARGRRRAESDVDVCVLVEDDSTPQRGAIYDFSTEFRLRHSLDIQPVVLSGRRYSDMLSHELRLALDIERDGIAL